MRHAFSTVLGAVMVSLAMSTVGQAVAADSSQRMARIAFVSDSSPAAAARTYDAFRQRLHQLGWVEGESLTIESFWGEGHTERLPELMAEALAGKPDVLVTIGTPGALAAKKATSTVPIVVAVMGDPVHSGVVSNLARPEGNLTAISTGYSGGFPGKWLELLLEVRPRTKTVAVLWNLGNPVVQAYRDGLERAAVARRVKLYFIDVRKREELESAFRQAKRVAQAGVVVPENLVINNRPLVVGLATKYRLPTIYGLPEFVQDGGLISYGTDMRVMARRGAEYVDKILRGAKPADLPVQEPVTFLLSVNLTSAKALGITIPESILSRADEVIK